MKTTTLQRLTLMQFWSVLDSVNNADERRELIKSRCEWDFEAFCCLFFYSTCKCGFADFHREFFDFHVRPERNKSGLFLWPRGHAKSTIITRIGSVHDVCYRRERYILVFADTASQSRQKLRAIKRDFETNQMLRWVFGDAILPAEPWRENLFVVRNGVIIQSSSSDSESRGFIEGDDRPSKCIYDDIESTDGSLSPVVRQRLKNWHGEVAEFIGSPEVNTVYVGTLTHPDCLLVDLSRRADIEIHKHAGLTSFPESPLWEQWQKIYTDLDNDRREAEARAFYELNRSVMDSGGRVLWESNKKPKYPSKLYELMATRVNVGVGAFNKEIQNEPIDPERIMFDMDSAEYFTIEDRTIVRDGGHRIPINQLTIYGVHDPAGAPTHGGRTDYAAIGYMGRDRSGRLYLLDMWLRRCPESEQIEAAYTLGEQWRPVQFLLKRTGSIGMYEAYRKTGVARKQAGKFHDLRIGVVTETENKIERIGHMEPHITNKWLCFNRRLPREFFDQMRQFPNGQHDDGADVCHELWDKLKHGFQG